MSSIKSSDKPLKVVSFYVPLPDYLDVPDNYGVPIYVHDDHPEKVGIRTKKKNGDAVISDLKLSFYQKTGTVDMQPLEASLDLMAEVFGDKPKRTTKKDNSKITIAIMSCITDKESVDTNILTPLFDYAMESLRQYVRGYSMVTQKNIEMPSRQLCPPVIGYTVEPFKKEAGVNDLKKGLFMVHQKLRGSSSKDGLLDKSALDEIIFVTESYSGNFLDTFLDTRREAFLALEKGNRMLTGMLVGMASEILLDEVLKSLLWEDGYEPKQAHELLHEDEYDSVSKRVLSGLYIDRIGGNWNISSKGSIRNWWNSILTLRNKIAHVGYEPSEAECKKAIEALNELTSYLCDLLAEKIEEYPISCFVFLGMNGIKSRGKEETFKQIQTTKPVPINIPKAIGNWKFEVERFSQGEPFKGNHKRARVHYIFEKTGKEYWALVDEEKRLFRLLPDQKLDTETEKALNELRKKIKGYRKNKTTILVIPDFKAKYRKHSEDWLPYYFVYDQLVISPKITEYPSIEELTS